MGQAAGRTAAAEGQDQCGLVAIRLGLAKDADLGEQLR
jgi:hypothetical protein